MNEPKTVDLVLAAPDTAVPAPLAPEVAAVASEPSVIRRYIKARTKSHASTPKELATYVEYRFIDLIEQPGATAEQQFAALRELAKFPQLGLTPHNKSVLPPPAWEPAPDTVDVLERL